MKIHIHNFNRRSKISSILSMILVFVMLFSVSIPDVEAADRYTAMYPDYENQKCLFIVKADGFADAYVIGDFNGWQDALNQGDKYKLTWVKDSHDSVWKMMLDLDMNDVAAGTHNYKYLLRKKDEKGNVTYQEEVNASGWQGNNSTFEWKKPTPPPSEEDGDFLIKTSKNTVSATEPTEFLAIRTDSFENIDVLNNLEWKIEPAVAGASLENGYLKVEGTVADGTKITLKALETVAGANTKKVASKEIRVDSTTDTKPLLHFYKADGDYNGWVFHNFGKDAQGVLHKVDVEPSIDTDLGKAAYLDSPNVIMKKGNWEQETAKYVLNTDKKDLYILENDTRVYTSLKTAYANAGAKIKSAMMDSKESVVAYLDKEPKDGIEFELYVNGVKQDTITATVDKAAKKVVYNTTNLNFDPTALLEVKADNMFRSPRQVTLRRVLDDYLYTGDDMGVKYDNENDKIKFRLFAPTAYKVDIVTYGSAEQAQVNPDASVSMSHDASSGTYYATVDKDSFNNKYYLYKLYFKERNEEGNIVDRITYAVDPYAVAAGMSGDKGFILDIDADELKPAGWDALTRPELEHPEDAIIYETHVRDFTIDPNWGGDASKAGKYLGLVEAGTIYTNGAKTVSTGLDHLKELGVNCVHLLPTYDIATIEKDSPLGYGGLKKDGNSPNRNWGYDPKNYNVPEETYSSNPNDPKVAIKEFRQMVAGLHNNGIRLVLDQVYNHMYSTDNMNKIVPDYYFRSWDEGNLSNGAGCGNEVATERPMVRKFIVDSNMFWLKNYKVDGLRFDLMALIDNTTMREIKEKALEVDSSILVYGEPWKAADTPLAGSEQTTKNKGIAGFNDVYRNALRGDNSPTKGFVNGSINESIFNNVINGLKASLNLVDSPDLIINYAEAHDNYCIYDQIEKADINTHEGEFRKNIKENELEDWRVKKALLANSMVLTSQGIPFIQGGSEILRTKQGEHNSYNLGDDVNAIHWADKAEFIDVFNYYKDVIQFRKAHKGLRLTSKLLIDSETQVYNLNDTDKQLIMQHLKNNAGGDSFKNILIFYNGSINDKVIEKLPLSDKKWLVIADDKGFYHDKTSQRELEKMGEEGEDLSIKSSSMLILYDGGSKVKTGDIQWDYLFADQSQDYMEPLEPKSTDEVKVRFRAAADELESANVHYYDEADKAEHVIAMSKITDDTFYASKGYDKTKVEFWEGIIPASPSSKYYNFEAKSSKKTVWISGGAGDNGRGVTNAKPLINGVGSGIDHGFSIVPDYKTPKWAKEAVFYQIMVDRFRDGDSSNNRVAKDVAQFGKPSEIAPWNSEVLSGDESDKVWNNQFYGGDLQGVREAIPYLKDTLGVDALYLMPIFQSASDHKYDVDKYEYVDKYFGGNKGLADLSMDLSNENMNLILDGAFNHTSTEGDLFKHNKDYYFYDHGQYSHKFKDTDNNDIDYYAWHGYANLAKLNYSNQAVRDYIYASDSAVAKKYLKPPYNISGWRLDAAEDLNVEPRDYKQDPEFDMNTDQDDKAQRAANLQIWQEFRNNIKGTNKDAFILGEFWKNDNHWYYGKAWDSRMNYAGFMMPFLENSSSNKYLGNQSLDNKGGMSVAGIAKFARKSFKSLPYQTVISATNSISTHDKERFLNREFTGAGNEAMMEIVATLQMTYPGVPMIYYGDEIGSVGKANGKDPYNRGSFNWEESSWNKEMLGDHKNLIAARKANKDAFVYGAFEEIKSSEDDKYLVYARYGNNNRAIVVLNNNGNSGEQDILLANLDRYGFKDGDVLRDVLSDKEATVSLGKLTLSSKNMSGGLWVLRDKAPAKEAIVVNLRDLSDARSRLAKVENFKYKETDDSLKLTWDNGEESGLDSYIVRVYDGDKVVREKLVAKTEGEASFADIASLPANYTIMIKKLADRTIGDGTVDDIYFDSKYTEAIKDTTPDTTSGAGTEVTPGEGTGNGENTGNTGGSDNSDSENTDTGNGENAGDTGNGNTAGTNTTSGPGTEVIPDGNTADTGNSENADDTANGGATGGGSTGDAENTGDTANSGNDSNTGSTGASSGGGGLSDPDSSDTVDKPSEAKPETDDKKAAEKLSEETEALLKEHPDALLVGDKVFIDVEKSKWYGAAVEYVVEKGIMNGTGDTSFAPGFDTTRAMVVTMLKRLSKEDDVDFTNDFSDVKSDDWHGEAINWAVKSEIVNGIGNGEFKPNDKLSREQLVTILYRYAKYKKYNLSSDADLTMYYDLSEMSEYAIEPMQWAVANGIIKGSTATSLSPKRGATRAEMATIFMRFMEKL